MKKLLSILTAAVCVTACAFSFSACGDDSGNDRHTHTWSLTYTNDGDRHYQTCNVCGEKNYSEHEYGANGICVCGKENPNGTHTHSWSLTYTDDGDRHYQTCDGCSEKKYSEHVYDAKGICICGKQEKTEHIHNYLWVDNGDGTHKQQCSVAGCNEPDKNFGSHDYGTSGVCICGATKLIMQLNVDEASYTVTGINDTSVTEIIIPAEYKGKPVTSIGSSAFFNCESLTSVTIPDNIETIGATAFYNCNNLIYNEYDNACYLGNESNPYLVLAIAKDTSISSCVIHQATKIICGHAFSACNSLVEISIPNGVTSISDYAFNGCSGLERLEVEDGNSVYYNDGNCIIDKKNGTLILGCKNSIIPSDESVKYIGIAAFDSCSGLTSITIPNSVIQIGDGAFWACTSLTEVVIPNNVIAINDGAFYECRSLTSITIPGSVTKIGSFVFYNCRSLTNITYLDTVAKWEAIQKGSSWNRLAGSYTVHCTNDDIANG